ncbi:type 11 methyltransferase/S-adenosylmethionine-dependent methyltransferase 3-like protein 1 [Halorubrum distributum JCM 9100]|uniref:Type 11 methyltransferase/S-adenosylmethionine-dependent methyltransferase 3-like protein 1 n=5 Tax=Halorubrum distributum TaxID=29283 RepID=M0EES3_9EURY|nr:MULTISPECIES: class I SAM-dependent methyltransferase [Halorubrum distributum group]ELZ30762.1 type 11 methyltransferase/S-adenosylmethionine-dependent methyltransferase 3-like protein 1 [Halorubrum terrestre JCM 10247]ELZ46255.1 type 11 methyltransferase/S-adenosylmethionine-dependent methyltransferase 3-like protein 1 [Halorubrum distributum JCM 9100]ELZ50261.1 type 11 methyltransferase/S-adenosylmethionine-dependent methyltransferase 3-like protein 1 [Halorubrum distributum JCM 10118]EMA7
MERFQNTGQPDWDWWGKLWPTPGATLRDLGIEAGQSVAEVGCGSGYFALPAARIVEPAPVYAVDLDEALLDELGSLAERQAVENVVSVHGDARDLTELLPDPVDALVVANTFHGVDDRAAFVAEAFDAIAPGGSLIVVNWHDRPREATTVGGEPRGPPTELRMPPEETEGAVSRAAAFELDRRIDLPPYHYALVFRR